MGWLFYRIACLPETTPGRSAALTSFVVLLVVNTLWSWFFFAGHSFVWGLVDIAAQAIALAATVVLFGRLARAAYAGFLPVAMWVIFAGALNYEIWRMN
jgi:translocator protein